MAFHVRLEFDSYEDCSAGESDVLPELHLHAHVFLSEHIDRRRQYVTVPMPPRTLGDCTRHRFDPPHVIDLRARQQAYASGARVSPSATIGVEMYARSTLGRRHFDVDAVTDHQPFQVLIGGAVLYLSDLTRGAELTVDVIDRNDRTDATGETVEDDFRRFVFKGRVHMRVTAYDIDGVFAAAAADDTLATSENYVTLQQEGDRRAMAHLRSYRRLGLLPSAACAASLHVIRYITSPTGRQLMAVYFLARYVSGVSTTHEDAVEYRAYWESALRVALALNDIDGAEFLTMDVNGVDVSRIACTAATLFANAAVTYVGDHTNRARASAASRRAPIDDVERFVDTMVTRSGDCDDVAVQTYLIMRAAHQYDTQKHAASPLFAHVIQCIKNRYTPMVATGGAVDPSVDPRASIAEHERHSEVICHVYKLLMPRRFLVDAMRRAGHAVTDGTAARGGELHVCEGTTYQCPLVQSYDKYTDSATAAVEMRARWSAALQRATSLEPVVSGWSLYGRIADMPPFYGRVVCLFSDVAHANDGGDEYWIFGVAYAGTDDGRTSSMPHYGVRIEDLAAQRTDIIIRGLLPMTARDQRMSSDALKQGHPVIPVTGADQRAPPPAVPARLAALMTTFPPPVQLRSNAPRALLRVLRFHSFRWPVRPGPPEATLDVIERLLRVHRVYRGVMARAFRICGGQPTECGDTLTAAPVEMLEVRLYF